MKKTFYAKLCVWALSALACLCFSQAYAQNADGPEKDTVKIEKELPSGGAILIQKVGQEAAFATLEIDGEKVEIDAFEPLTRFPEEARPIVEEAWNQLGEIPKKTINVEIDVTEAPDAAEWAERAKSRVLYWYPKIVAMLDGEEAVDQIPDDFTIKLVFKDMDGVAHASGRVITVSSRYIKRNPLDFGLVVHETTHVAQAYPRCREAWAMEGLTDYIRYYITEARSKNRWRVDPERSKYTDSYGITATYFDWIVRNVDPEFIKKIHGVFRSRGSVERFVVNEYDKTCQELWDEFIASLNTPTGQR